MTIAWNTERIVPINFNSKRGIEMNYSFCSINANPIKIITTITTSYTTPPKLLREPSMRIKKLVLK